MPKIIGIDLGTTYTEAATMKDGHPEIILGDQKNPTTPSRVGVNNLLENPYIMGNKLRNFALKNGKCVVYEPKRIIGRRFEDEYVKRDRYFYPYTISCDDNGMPVYDILSPVGTPDDKMKTLNVSPQMISAQILKTMKNYIKDETDVSAVITVPSYFNKDQIDATMKAGEMAGLKVSTYLYEPVAAAISYGFKYEVTKKIVCVYDLGGGTFDFCVVSIDNQVYKILATDGHSHLGGADFDNAIIKWIRSQYMDKYHEDLYDNGDEFAKVKIEAERAKIALTTSESTTIKLSTKSLSGEKRVDTYTITRSEFEKSINSDVQRTLEYITRSLNEISRTKNYIDEVIIVGGSTRIPYVRKVLSEYFGRPIKETVNLEEAVAEGAAIYADYISRGIDLCRDLPIPHIDSMNPLCDPIMHPPYMIWIEAFNHYEIIIDPSKEFSNGLILINRSYPIPDPFDNAIPFTVYVSTSKEGKKEVVGYTILKVEAPITRGMTRVLSIHCEYNCYGILHVSLEDKKTCTLDTISVCIRGDNLDDSEIRDLQVTMHSITDLCDKCMMLLCRKGNDSQCVKDRQQCIKTMAFIKDEAAYASLLELRSIEKEMREMKERVN